MFEKIVLVTRRTRLEGLVARYSTALQAEFVIERSGGDFSDYEEEHEEYGEALKVIRRSLPRELKLQVLDRDFLPNYVVAPTDLVITLGQDGLVANTAKYVKGQPIIAVNPEPDRFDGILLPFQVQDVGDVVRRAVAGSLPLKKVTLAQASLADGQRLLAFNDLFIGASSHVSARYQVRLAGRTENQSSSGIIVSTGAGSTGWLSSVFHMATGVSRFAGQSDIQGVRMNWDEDRLLFVVREPFVSKTSTAGIVAGEIESASSLVIESRMPTEGVIFSDGVESDRIEFNSGAVATISIAPEKASLATK